MFRLCIIYILLIGLPADTVIAEINHTTITQVTITPRIDGRLDDEVWKQATIISDFQQVEPIEGAAPGEKTMLYLAYD